LWCWFNHHFLEEQGAQITGIDLAPDLIAMARQEAVNRGAKARFVQANVLNYPLGEGIYDLAVSFGNAITDFPHRSFPRFRDRVFDAVKPGGHFILEHIDGLERVAFLSEPKEANSTYKMEYQRLSTNETYECTEYVYTGPLIRLLLEVRFEFVRSIRLDHSFMDVYIKR
jgi:SAM-dependent methyltransferase